MRSETTFFSVFHIASMFFHHPCAQRISTCHHIHNANMTPSKTNKQTKWPSSKAPIPTPRYNIFLAQKTCWYLFIERFSIKVRVSSKTKIFPHQWFARIFLWEQSWHIQVWVMVSDTFDMSSSLSDVSFFFSFDTVSQYNYKIAEKLIFS